MTNEYFTASELEARKMISDFRENNEWTPNRQMMLATWKLMWSSSLPMERIDNIANAIFPHEVAISMQKMCTHAVRGGLLRTRMSQGVRHYELALA